jgi:hypothetical protein
MAPTALPTKTSRSRPEQERPHDALRPREPGLHLRSAPARIWQTYKRLTQLGFPRRFPIVQFPNPPLIIAFVASMAGRYAHGSDHTYATSLSYLAMTIWAYEELARGVNWFRHLLGGAYMIIMIERVAHALHP